MIVTAERPVKAVMAKARPEPDGAAARELALVFLRSISACWRGEECAARFATRLSAYWRAELPVLPGRQPDALSPHGAGGRGIAWFQMSDAVLGSIPGCAGGYLVPISAVPGLARCVPSSPGEWPHDPVAVPWTPSKHLAPHGAAA